MNVAIVVPRRADGGHRDRLWQFVRDWWSAAFPQWKIVEGHHDDGLFNRGAAINRGARDAGEWDVVVVADGDVVADPDLLGAAVQRAVETGRMTFAFDRYVYLAAAMTERVLDGYHGSWEQRGQRERPQHLSSLQVVPRALWEQVNGFDERFVGWGAEDDAFAHACRVLGGGIERIAGTAWHLWHPETPGRTRTVEYGEACALLRRYEATVDPEKMRAFVAERDTDLVVVVTTDGRRDCIARTIPTLTNLQGLTVGRRLIVDDSGDRDYQAWLRVTFPDWDLVCASKRHGFAAAVRTARAYAVESGQPWVWWHEDDFLLPRPVDLRAMRDTIETHPHLQQIALLRQPWWQGEKDAGGLIAERADKFVDRDGWVEHQLFWTQNPHLVSRRHLAANVWPAGANSEAKYGRVVLTGENRSAFWGGRDDEPRITHIGDHRAGTGY